MFENLYVNVGGERFWVHRLILKMMTGGDPVIEIDHWDRNAGNNRWTNLRLATRSENNCNKASKNTSGYKGVYWNNAKNKWQAQIMVGRKQYYLGRFDCAEAAYQAYGTAAFRLHGKFASTGGVP